MDAEGRTNDLHMINPHVGYFLISFYLKINHLPQEASVLRRLRRSDNFVFSSSSSSSSSSSGKDGKVYFTQQSTHNSNAHPSFANRFGGDDDSYGSSTGFGAGGFGNRLGGIGSGAKAGAGTGGFVFDNYGGGAGGSNYASVSGSHHSGSGGAHYNAGSSGSGTDFSSGHIEPESGNKYGHKKATGQTIITSGVIDNGKVHANTHKIDHYNY